MPGIANYYSSLSRDRSNNNKRKSTVFVLEDALPRTDDDTPKYEYCQSCYEVGIMSRLKDRILLDDEGKLLPTPTDNENYLQCWNCGKVTSIKEVKREGKISGISGVEAIDNPNDFGKSRIVTIGNDGLKGSIDRIKKRQQRELIDDQEVQAFLDKGYELKSYSKKMP